MKFATRCVVVAFAALVVLFCGTSARADSVTFDLTYLGSYSGDTISGNLVVNAVSDGGGVYTAYSVSGTQLLNGILESVNTVVPSTTERAFLEDEHRDFVFAHGVDQMCAG